ncbi:hypothetical protein Rhsp01_58710 [Rhizobium sp. NBRC 114257]|uniref:Uncharacterized protein n=1 Tax=Rhizobium dioscoreae TaxID=2653122 RepID=A0ABQ0ZCG2_9HYPH|nr:hypothetical protein RsS93_58690 [Rhizobium dioscoreae]GLU84695.1 hypothetical protein Rhsp01_58710 [Rhizobium sp. NBRC 114257]
MATVQVLVTSNQKRTSVNVAALDIDSRNQNGHLATPILSKRLSVPAQGTALGARIDHRASTPTRRLSFFARWSTNAFERVIRESKQ